MKQHTCLLIVFIIGLLTFPIYGQALIPNGKVLEGLQMPSAILGRDLNYAIYLPPDYDLSTRRYPVVYLLHGFTDNETGWIQFGEAPQAADRAIAERAIPPMIIVMPDGGVTWYINDYQGKNRWEDAFIEEFIPYIDATYRTRPAKEYRGISGLSMGGWGSLLLSMRHPELFAACAAFSAAVWLEKDLIEMDDKNFERVVGGLFGHQLKGKDRLNAHFRQYNPLDLVKNLPAEELKQVRYYLDCGDDDFLIPSNCQLHIELSERKIPHEFRVRDGSHQWHYWRSGIVEGLKFIGESFHR
ncbi:esterase family protein [candidate division KSB1 bacterium]|nr:esterase family protein [candidate division KSB1 bacterium]